MEEENCHVPRPTYEISETHSQKIEKAGKLKLEGNEHFNNSDYKIALRLYHKALLYVKGLMTVPSLPHSHTMYITSSDSEDADRLVGKAQALSADIYNNVAACLLKMEPVRYKRIIECCNEVLKIKQNNLKAWYRLGLCHYHMENYVSAKEALLKAYEISSKDVAVQKLLNLVQLKLKEEEKQCDDLLKSSQLKNAFV